MEIETYTTLGLNYDGCASISVNTNTDVFGQISHAVHGVQVPGGLTDTLHMGSLEDSTMVNYASQDTSIAGYSEENQPPSHSVMSMIHEDQRMSSVVSKHGPPPSHPPPHAVGRASPDEDPKSFNYDNVMVWLNQQSCGGTVKRKRRITRPQRVAANMRERRRMVHLNTAFESLKETIPIFPHEKKLSRIQTLKLAIDYIGFMTDLLHGTQNTSFISSLSSPNSGPDSGSHSPPEMDTMDCWQS